MRADLNAKLGWEKKTDKQCQAEYEVQFQNIGKLPIKIEKSRISVWYLSEPTKAASPVEYIDPLSMKQQQLFSEDNDRLNNDYAPGTKDSEGFSFVVQKANRRMLFEIDIFGKDSNGKPEHWHDFHWDNVCGDEGQK